MKKITVLLFALLLLMGGLQVIAQNSPTTPAKKAKKTMKVATPAKGKPAKATTNPSTEAAPAATTEGFKLTRVVKGTGEKVTIGSNVEIHMDVVNYKDSSLGSSRQMGKPFPVKVKASPSPIALENALTQLCVGDSAVVKINSDKYFAENGGEAARPPFIPKGTDITYKIKVVNVIDMAKVAKENEDKIEAYIKERKLTVTKYDNGLRVAIEREGTGAFPKAGENVTVHYRGTLLNGKQFDASYDRNQPFSFVLGKRNVIMGWEEGIPKIKIGGKGILLIPSDLGYGERGAGQDIAPNSPLVFEVEVLDSKVAEEKK